jgi:putative addiction module component (TIGR02574 family)
VAIMNARAEALRSELLALPEAERARLSIDLLDSLDDRPVEGDSAELDRIWAEETARRAAQIDSGAVKMDSWDDLMSKVAEARRTP